MKKLNLQKYDQKKAEVSYFLDILKKFDKYSKRSSGKFHFKKENFIFEDYFKMLRSSFILILYSYIESSVSLFMEEIYTHLETQQVQYSLATDNLKEIYLRSLFLDTLKKDSSYNTYEKKALLLVKKAIEDENIFLSISKLEIAGNIDSTQISNIWEKHGIRFNSSSRSQDKNGKFSIDNIKLERNALAHGRENFIKTGGKFSINDLTNYFNEISKLLDDLKKSVEQYIEKEEYLKKKK